MSAAARLLNMRIATVSQYYDNLRGEWYDNLVDEPISFESNDEYEVDECLLKHVWYSERNRHELKWIGGILERTTGKVVLYQVKNRSRASLLPPILQHIPAS